MSFLRFRLALPPTAVIRGPNADESARILLARYCEHVLNGLARCNAEWVLRQWELGNKPACCAKCGGVRYVPNTELTNELSAEASPIILANKVASCESIAACHTGHKVAEAFMGVLPTTGGGLKPAVDFEEACRRYRVVMAAGPDPSKPRLLHAKCDDDGRLLDATEGMPR